MGISKVISDSLDNQKSLKYESGTTIALSASCANRDRLPDCSFSFVDFLIKRYGTQICTTHETKLKCFLVELSKKGE